MSILEGRNVYIACLQETLRSPPISINIPRYSNGRSDRLKVRPCVKNGYGIAFIIKSGISYTVSDKTFNHRGATTGYASLVIYPIGDAPSSICNDYRHQQLMRTPSLTVWGGPPIYRGFSPCANLVAGLSLSSSWGLLSKTQGRR